ncbi:hypothetical protein PMZ80_005852 [Knufia obscura]|uniref:Uncharacterized protein n=2 Tax=Knufia TaxID=430999 RepID=A0AAN8EFK5_9EURO|nr:hypothetical protein PMZ80_005852 [Knufia obscura]KAK5954519.1 hypothetical protein OHC33_004241 [Knufia fluminis]
MDRSTDPAIPTMNSEGGEEVIKADGASTTDTKSDKVKTPPISNYWRILSFGTRLEHAVLIVAIACAAASGVPLPLMNIVFGTLTERFNEYFLPESGITERQFKDVVAQNTLYIVYLFIGKFVLTYVSMFFFRTSSLRISAALRLGYLQALFSQPVKKLDEVSAGAVANTITSSANTIQLSISDRLAALFQSLALVIAAYAIAFRYSWALTLATSSGILFVIVVYSITTPIILKSLQRITSADEKHATVAAEVVSSIRNVFALGAESKMITKHNRWVDESHKYAIKIAPQFGMQLSPMYFAIYACYALAFWFGLKLFRDGSIGSVGTVIIVFFSVLIVTSVMGQIVQPIFNISKAIGASASFFDMIDSDRVDASGLREPDVSAHGDIELGEVTFAYPTRPNVQVLKNFSATFQAGKTTALVGPSGSGKSTIVALLERWYDLPNLEHPPSTPESTITSKHEAVPQNDSEGMDDVVQINGCISSGGHSVNKFDLKWWRSQIGLVQQEPFLFNDTIENNVAYGLIGTQFEHVEGPKRLELVQHACREAFADEFIRKLPKEYSTLVGEGGMKLSGGQRQRIAIARSIVRQPAILILDEATSAIDVQGEKIVQQALERASKNRTTIVIAHRLSTIRKADHIVVLRHGTKVEEGTHDQLLSVSNGVYSGLVRAQMIEEDRPMPEASQAEGELMVAERTLSYNSERLGRSATANATIDDVAEAEGKASGGSYTKKGIFKTVGLLLYEQRPRWPFYNLVLLAAMACGAAYALQSWFFGQLVQTFQYTGQRLIDAANFWSLMFFILALAVGISYAILGTSSGVISAHTGTFCRKDYFKSTLGMPIAYFDREENSSGTVMSRLSGDPKQIQELLGLNSSVPMISIFNIIGCVIISFYFGWKLTLVTFFAVLPVILGASFMRMRYEVTYEVWNAQVFEASSQFATEAVGAFRTVSSLTMEDVVIDKYRNLLQDQIKSSTRKATYATLIYALTDSIELLGMALAFWYGGQLLASTEYSPIQFFVIYAAIIQGAQAAGQYLSIGGNIAHATSAANRIIELRAKSASHDPTAISPPTPRTSLGAKIEFKNVNFTYPSNTTPLFSNLNLTIQPGQFVAFVGPSGCGKTTTISLLERFYDPTSGTITVDNQDITTLSAPLYRRDLALVSQEPRLFSGTIRQNLLLGIPDDPDSLPTASVSDSDITQACRDAEIHEFITSLPEGYDTELGQHTQTALSGGQKQRLCLARALLRKPKLLLLDEATSSLDSQSERLVQGAIERLAGAKEMTVVAVAHRLATVQKADVIFVFGERDAGDDGVRRGSRVVESGSHGELLGRRGVYWSMCQAQALDA